MSDNGFGVEAHALSKSSKNAGRTLVGTPIINHLLNTSADTHGYNDMNIQKIRSAYYIAIDCKSMYMHRFFVH